MENKLTTKLKKMRACPDAIEWCEKRGYTTVEEAWNNCERGEWMLWLYRRIYPNNLREITLAKGHCANTVRHLMKDERSIKAVDSAIAFGEGKITIEELNAAYAAAYAAYDAYDASYAASYAAYAAYAASYAAAAAASYAASYAAYAAAAYAAYAAYDAYDDAYDEAEKQNQKETSDICRKYLTIKENNQ